MYHFVSEHGVYGSNFRQFATRWQKRWKFMILATAWHPCQHCQCEYTTRPIMSTQHHPQNQNYYYHYTHLTASFSG